jgi:hypothetical protein
MAATPDETKTPPGMPELTPEGTPPPNAAGYEEFEIGHHKVPWFLWVFFTLIIIWASLSWIPFFGY